jgi:glycosyltransferase involved in cell wall biosynthesis
MVSIIIPYKIDRGWLDEAIQSVYNQTYDGKIELLISKSDKSVSYNINQALKIAKGDYIKYLCDDDTLTPNCIEDSVNAIQGFDFLHGVANNVFPTYAKLQHPRMTNPMIEDMLVSNVIHGGTLFYKMSTIEKVGYFDESLVCAEEYDYNLRCFKLGMKLGFTNKILYNYRRHDLQKSLGKGIDQEERALRIKAIQDKWR